jgi:integrase
MKRGALRGALTDAVSSGKLAVVRGLEFNEPKTTSGRRTIPLGPKAMDALRTHRVTQTMERERNGLPRASETDLVFASEVGTPIDPSNLLANTYYPLLTRAGLPRLTFNAGTRHTAATLMIGAGTHIRVVAERLGHADPAITLRVYSHVTPTMQREAADKLDAVLTAGRTG